MVTFRRWFEAGFGPDLLPIIPPGAPLAPNSTVRPEHRGKTPGVHNADGAWSGLSGKWSDDLRADIANLKRWQSWGASIGLQARNFPGLDIDVEDPKAASAIEGLALEHFGFAPVRERPGSPRRLLVYRASGLRKTRLAWTDAKDVKHAVELLGHGQQYVVEGPHPKGRAYSWHGNESPCEWGPDALTPITADMVQDFFAALARLVERNGGTILKGGSGPLGAAGPRKSLSDRSLWAARPELVLTALKAWPNTADNVPTHDDFVTALAAIKAALGPDRDAHYGTVEEWALGYASNDANYVRKTWASITDAALGADWLFQHVRASGQFTDDAQQDFDDAGETLIGETPLERMLARYVWVQQLERYADLQTGEMLSGRAFNAANVHVAPFGKAGVNSAEAEFQNARGARKAAIATYRPGRPVLIEDESQNGARVRAVNLWRPSPLKPATNVTDADVAIWLDHVAAIFGERGEPSREHFLDWCAFALQRPGVKINHALVLLGGQGVGKDTVFQPIFDAIGEQNRKVIGPETLAGQWTHYLLTQIVVVEEMMNFERRELYNRLKAMLAAPPTWLEINQKNQRQFAVPNTQLWVFFTNEDAAIAMDEDDRRFWVHRSCLDEKREQAYYDRIYAWYADGGAEKVAGWLLARDVSHFNSAAPPPLTTAKREMIDHATPLAVRWLTEQFEEGGPFAGRTIVAVRELVQHARTAIDAPGKVVETIREKFATAALRRVGYKPVDRKVRLNDGTVTRLWSSKSPELLAQREPRFLLTAYEQDAARGEARRRGA